MSTRPPLPASDWSSLPLGVLTDEITASEHAYLRRTLSQLNKRLVSVAATYGLKYRGLQELAQLFVQLERTIQQYLRKEENGLFPRLKQLGRGTAVRETDHAAESVDALIQDVSDQQERVVDLLHRIRELTDGYQASSDVCPSYKAALDGLAELDQVLAEHYDKEDRILFCRAKKL